MPASSLMYSQHWKVVSDQHVSFFASSNDNSVDGLRFDTTRRVVGAGCVYSSERHIGASPRVNQVQRPIGAIGGPTSDSCP
jgi:hypothetical protein